MQVKYEKIHEDAIAPIQSTLGSAGFDLFSIEEAAIYPGETRIVHTGIKVELPPNHLMYISSKGGPAGKNNVFVLNSPGLVDSDYRGEIIVILHKVLTVGSWFEQPYMIKKGQKIAQFVILPYPQIQLVEQGVDMNTERGEGALGSTGLYYNE